MKCFRCRKILDFGEKYFEVHFTDGKKNKIVSPATCNKCKKGLDDLHSINNIEINKIIEKIR